MCSLSLDNEVEYIELFHIAQAASMWEAKASIFLRDGASLEDFKALRRFPFLLRRQHYS